MSSANSLSPFLAFVNPESLEIQPNTGRYRKYLRELDGIYEDQTNFRKLVEACGNEVAYRVEEARFTDGGSDLITGISVLEPGKVGSEFFMTRGHLHQRADRPETYYCLAGHGILLMETLEGRIEAPEIRSRTLLYVPPFCVHLTENILSLLS